MEVEYKGYLIKPMPSLIGYEIEYKGRGSAHGSLRGMFTSKKIAIDFIDRYADSKERKEDQDDEKLQSGGSQQVQRRAYHRRQPSNKSR